MKIGIFLDLRNPPPWARPWVTHVAQTIERVVAAERDGLDAVWLSEHHQFTDGYLPQPLAFASALAARTERIRIGTAIMIAPLHQPAHLAEQAALADIISNGRIEVGLGTGYAPHEFALFGQSLEARYGRTDAALAELRRLLDDGVVTPHAVQRPFPIWAGYQGPQGAARAGRLGVGLLSLDRTNAAIYAEALDTAGHGAASARLGGVVDLVVCDDPERTKQRLLPHLAWQRHTYAEARGPGAGTYDETLAKLTDRLAQKGELPGFAVCTADDAIALLRTRTEGLPVEHVYLWASLAGMPDDLVDRHIELLTSQVRPALVTKGA
jgi:alkanesulfonate monooxygenase SsuD/methylene tetrahydromethanopterin reductase-like flavin-dependent oxidoreductase (luciferase family)